MLLIAVDYYRRCGGGTCGQIWTPWSTHYLLATPTGIWKRSNGLFLFLLIIISSSSSLITVGSATLDFRCPTAIHIPVVFRFSTLVHNFECWWDGACLIWQPGIVLNFAMFVVMSFPSLCLSLSLSNSEGACNSAANLRPPLTLLCSEIFLCFCSSCVPSCAYFFKLNSSCRCWRLNELTSHAIRTGRPSLDGDGACAASSVVSVFEIISVTVSKQFLVIFKWYSLRRVSVHHMQLVCATSIYIIIYLACYNNNNNNPRTIFIVLSSWPGHCESSLGSSGECSAAPSGRRPSDQATWLGLPVRLF